MSPDGYSDSSGSVTGNLLGKLYGVDAIPQTWLEPLGLRNAIMEIAEARTTSSSLEEWLHCRDGNGQKARHRISRKHPGHRCFRRLPSRGPVCGKSTARNRLTTGIAVSCVNDLSATVAVGGGADA